jgi:hypothetical protein
VLLRREGWHIKVGTPALLVAGLARRCYLRQALVPPAPSWGAAAFKGGVRGTETAPAIGSQGERVGDPQSRISGNRGTAPTVTAIGE